jgi:Uncharacterized conserved protein
MRPRPLCDKLNEFLTAGLANDIFLAVQTHLLEVSGRKNSLGPLASPGMVSAGGISVDEFLLLLDENRYSAVFTDGALLLIQCTFVDDRLDTHRYSYIPCPIDPQLLDLRPEEITLADWLRESITAKGVGAFRSTGTYRFDCVRLAPSRDRSPHPISHLTFGSPDCRVPVRSPLSIADFLNFVFDNFYREHRRVWLEYSSHLTCSGTDMTITVAEQQLHHLHWEEL